MTDIIKRLPEIVANQIAAGEVIQRPASVVKELLENSIDAGATHLQLLIEESGKTRIQLIDNGKGMTEVDARMCFERHATSKIYSTEDLFHITTMGFRGEALASVASVAEVELKSKMADQELGTQIVLEGGIVQKQEPIVTPVGTSITVKNLFYNVPARKKFLKKDLVELKHVITEFERVALAHPECSFQFINNGKLIYDWSASDLRFRIATLFGKNYKDNLITISEQTDLISIEGYIGKVEQAKKTRGEQFFFLNGRYIKSPYLHNALSNAYSNFLNTDFHPSYFLFLTVNPEIVDINIHPSKAEVKFEDEAIIYGILLATIKKALSKSALTPLLDFEQQEDVPIPFPQSTSSFHQVPIDNNYTQRSSKSELKSATLNTINEQNWLKRTYQEFEQEGAFAFTSSIDEVLQTEQLILEDESYTTVASAEETLNTDIQPYQIHNTFIQTHIVSGLMLIHQQRASERILYEESLNALQSGTHLSKQILLFPHVIELQAIDLILVEELAQDFDKLGFTIQKESETTIAISAVPTYLLHKEVGAIFTEILDQFRNEIPFENGLFERLAWSFAQKIAIKSGQPLQPIEMRELINKLFSCENPQFTPTHKPILVKLKISELLERFQ